jgi:hypothetical protein
MAKEAPDFGISRLGQARIVSPLQGIDFVRADERVVFHADWLRIKTLVDAGKPVPTFEKAGPREKIYFDPSKLKCGIVTCGGLCPGLNNVIRAIVLSLHHNYGVRTIFGFPFGYEGLSLPLRPHRRSMLTPEAVEPHPRAGRHHPGVVAGQPGRRRDGGHAGAHEHRRCSSPSAATARCAGRGAICRRGPEAGQIEDRRGRHPQDDRQRHLLRGALVRLRHGLSPGRCTAIDAAPTWRPRARATGSGWSSSWAASRASWRPIACAGPLQ